MEWYLMVWKKFAQFSGRSRRKEYWMFFLFNTLIGIVLYGAGLALRANGIGKILFILIPIVGPIILLVFFMVAGNPGANEYGPDPKSA